jgi:polysaccharide biosynthesis/export protein
MASEARASEATSIRPEDPKIPTGGCMRIYALLITMVVCGFAQQQQGQRPAAEPVTANLPIQKVGPNDLIAVSVYDSPELTRAVRVDADGLIHLPMLKGAITASGRMPAQLEREIARALVEEKLIVDPFVTVTVAEYSSRPISVTGAVKTPLTFQATGPVTLLEAITRAGGVTGDAGNEILVSRKSDGLVQRVSAKALIEKGEAGVNLDLTGGEEVRVPEAGKIFVIGNVRKPGAYPLQGDSATTVLEVLALAEGLSPNAGSQAFVFRREAGSANKNEIPVELKKILDRRAPDTALTASDILYVPDNRGRRLGLAALERILMFGTTAGATALVWR